MNFNIIAAADSKMGIGIKGKLPWNLPGDLAYFNKVSRGSGNNAVIMGRLTWESLPAQHRPLKNRLNIIITRNINYKVPENCIVASSLEKAIDSAKNKNCEEVFVIGGAQIFAEAILSPACKKIYLTEIEGNADCDTFFPKIDDAKFKKTFVSESHNENGIIFKFAIYQIIR